MKQADLKIGLMLEGKFGDQFEIVGEKKIKSITYYLVRFIKTDNYQLEIAPSIPTRVVDLGKPFLCGVGYISSTKAHPAKRDGSQYKRWAAMIERCYGGYKKNYQGVTVCDEWHDFINFQRWADNEKHGKDFAWSLDKDLLNGTFKVYSPKTCVFLPESMNLMLSNNNALKNCLTDNFSAVKVYKLKLLLDKYRKEIKVSTYKYIKELVSRYEEAYKENTGHDLKDDFGTKLIPKRNLVSNVNCVCLIKCDRELLYFSDLDEIRKWVNRKEREINKSYEDRDVYIYNGEEI